MNKDCNCCCREIELEILDFDIFELDCEITDFELEENSLIEWKKIDVPVYDGEYIIIPKAYEDQNLETKDKLLEKDILVKKVPSYEVSNKDGTTFYIATEVI
jgi:hypothetical protein